MGSKSDSEVREPAGKILKEFGISFEVKVLSVHRTPDQTISYAKIARDRGEKVIIAGASGAAHLPGIIAWVTTLPVIGVPIKSKELNGLDSLLSSNAFRNSRRYCCKRRINQCRTFSSGNVGGWKLGIYGET